MPLTIDETVALSPKVIALAAELAACTAAGSVGGRKITRTEARRIVQLTLELAQTVILDVLD